MASHFANRLDAGIELAQRLAGIEEGEAVVLALPRGGVPVSLPVARRLKAPVWVVATRKLPIPWNPEAGFGAVTADGTVVLNEAMVEALGLGKEEIDRIKAKVLEEVRRRDLEYLRSPPPEDLAGKVAVLVDDGLATGYTMMAAVEMVKKLRPKRVVVAIPVSPRTTLERLRPMVDEVLVLVEEGRTPFAVADYYDQFSDLTDEEVLGYLRQAPRRSG